ncbi:MAG: hypothetical protein E7041_03115 [Lentisphaerae bacterium]|nr:hypothetical protein [Lentisphaerota bacterium]
MSDQLSNIEVDAIVTTGGTAAEIKIGDITYTGTAEDNLGEYLSGNSTGVSVVVDNYTHDSGSIRNLLGVEIIGGSKAVLSNGLANTGGGMHLTGKKASFVSGLTFSNNVADGSAGYGGGLYNAEGIVTVSNMLFDHNYAKLRGGAVQSLDAQTVINDSVFTGNTSGSLGGAINNYSPNDEKTGVVTINGGTFSENQAVDGSAIANSDILKVGASLTTGKDALFVKNVNGYAIMNCFGGTVYIGNVTFDGNTKGAIDNRNSVDSKNGNSPLVVIDGMITLKTSYDKINNASVIKIDCDAFLSDTQLIAKVINNPGAAAVATLTLDTDGLNYSVTQSKIGSDILIMQSGLELNAAIVSTNGGICQTAVDGTTYYSTGYSSLATALASDFKTVVLDGCTHNSGTISLGNGDQIIGINGALIAGAALSGTAAVTIAAGNTVSISGMTFADNVTSGNAPGAISAAAAEVTVSDTLFYGNRSNKAQYGYGGAIRNVPVSGVAPAGMFTILGSTFTNSHSTNGGAIYNSNIMTIGKGADGKDTLFCNSSGDYAILNCTGGTLTIGNVTFDGNAKGAIDNRNQTNSASGTACLIVVDGLLTLKSATDTIRNSSKMRVDGASFISGKDTAFAKVIDANNSGWLSGNAISATDGYKTFTGNDNDLYVTNAANVAAAAVVSGSKTAIVTVGDTVYNGTAFDSFGAAVAAAGTIVVDNYTYGDGQIVMDKSLTVIGGKNALFANNIANGVAGAVFQKTAKEKIDLTISGVTFSGNQAPGKNAGVIQHVYGGTLTLKDVLFDGNKANHGGTVQVGSSARVDNVTFINNSVTGYGGAFYNAEGKDVVIANSYFGNNSAVNRGGAMHLLDGVVAINDCIFENNSVTTADTTNHGFGGAINQFSSSDPAVKDGTVTISGGTFADNSAGMGSAIATTWNLVIQAGKTDGKAVLFSGNRGSAAILVAVSGGTHSTTISDAIFDGNDGAIDNRGVTYVADTEFKTATDTVVNSGTLTFSGSITLNAALSGNGTYVIAKDTVFTNAVDLSAVNISVDGSLYQDKAVTIATGVTAIGKYTTGVENLYLTVENGSLILRTANVTGDVATFAGTGSNLMTAGEVNTFFADKSGADNIATTIQGGKVESNLVGGAYVSAGNTAAVDKVELNIGDAEVAAKVYAGGYLYGNGTDSAEAQLTVKSVNITIDGGAVSTNMYGGAHARQFGNASVTEVNITVTAGNHGRIYAGGWAEKGAESYVTTANVTISGGTVDYLYGAGANADGKTFVGNTTITIENDAVVNTIFMSGRYGYSWVDNVSLTFDGKAKVLKRLSGVSSAGMDYAKSTTVELATDVTADLIDYVDKFVINEDCTLTANDAFYLGNRLEGGAKPDVTTFDFIAEGDANWTAVAGISDFTNAKFAVNGSEAQLWDGTAAIEIGGYELTYDAEKKTITLANA